MRAQNCALRGSQVDQFTFGSSFQFMIVAFGWGAKRCRARISRGEQRCPREAANLSCVDRPDIATARCLPPALAPKLSILCAVLIATTVAGCARHPAQRAGAAELRTCPSEKVVVAPQPAPDCEFSGTNLKTVDPREFARLKAAYERRCYRRAEKAARERQRLLQASQRCEPKPRYSRVSHGE
jgi:hypothetical protein